jgi:hypothetical protein
MEEAGGSNPPEPTSRISYRNSAWFNGALKGESSLQSRLSHEFLVANLTDNTLIVIAFERPISHFFPGCQIVPARIDAIISAPTRY